MEFELAYCRLVAATQLQSLQVAQAVASEFGDSLLTAGFVSDEHVDFICRVLLDPVVAKRPGLDELILALYIDRENCRKVSWNVSSVAWQTASVIWPTKIWHS